MNPLHHLRRALGSNTAQVPETTQAVGKDPHEVLPTHCLDKILLTAMEADRAVMNRLAGVSRTWRSHVLDVATHLRCGSVAQSADAARRAVRKDGELPPRLPNFRKADKALLRQAREHVRARQRTGVVVEASVLVRQHQLKAAAEALEQFMQQGPEFGVVHHELAEVYHLQGRSDAALMSFERATPQRLRDLAVDEVVRPELARRLGYLAVVEGDRELAEAYYLKAIALKPEYYEAHLALSGLYAHHEPQKAKEHAQSAIGIDRGRFQGHFQLALLHEQSGELQGAKASYSQCLGINAGEQKALFGQGRVAFRLGDFAEALSCLAPAADQVGNNEAILYWLSKTQRAVNHYDQAEVTCLRALAQNPHAAGAHWELGCIAHERGNYDAASVSYEKVLAFGVQDGEFYSDLGFNHLAQGRNQDAELSFRRATGGGLRLSRVYRGLGHAMFNQRMFEQAAIAYGIAIHQGAETVDVWEHLGDAQIKLGKLVEAVATFQKAMDRGIARPRTHLLMGSALLASQKLPQAISHFHHAVEQGHEGTYAFSTLGQLHLRVGQFALAQHYYRRSLSIDEAQPEVWNELGYCERALKRHVEGRNCFERAQAMASEMPEDRRKAYVKHREGIYRYFNQHSFRSSARVARQP